MTCHDYFFQFQLYKCYLLAKSAHKTTSALAFQPISIRDVQNLKRKVCLVSVVINPNQTELTARGQNSKMVL